jgi:hypothetical protein
MKKLFCICVFVLFSMNYSDRRIKYVWYGIGNIDGTLQRITLDNIETYFDKL